MSDLAERPDGLAKWRPQEEWRHLHAGHLFETPDAWAWFYRTHRNELLEAEAIGLNAGRIVVHVDRIVPVLEQIFTSRAHRVYRPRKPRTVAA